MKRLLLSAVVVLALPASASASVFTTELGSPFPAGNAAYGVVANDFNGDGFPDVAVINGTGSTMNVYLRQPTGGFVQEAGSPYSTGVGSGPNFGVSADFNRDGLNDIAVANFVFNSVLIFLRNPAGGFTVGQSVGLSGQGSAIAVGEVNGDGFVDLVATNFSSQGLNVLRGQGDGTFSNQEITTVGSSARQLTLADFNADGALDVAVANEASNSVSILLRNPGRTAFTTETTVPVGATPSGVVAADFNRDGRTDVAVSTRGGDPSTVTLLYRNAANNGFDAGPIVPIPAGPLGMATADFDRNGTPDIAVTGNAAGVVTVLSGGTTLDTSLPLERAYFPATADFNRDGQPDLVVTSDTLNGFMSFLNSTAPPQQPPPTPTPTPTATPVATPVAGTTVNAEPVKGTVKVKLPRTNRYVDLKTAGLLPVGTEVDARKGTIELTAAGQGGKAKFFDGIFKISQTKGARPLTTLTLTEQLSCTKAKKTASSAAAKKKTRKLWGDGKGAFRTQGKYSAATVRGTKWLVTDYCDRTVTKVTQGTVTVRDQVKKINKVVRKGKSYTARQKRK
ncbi:VCBS repeat-containing protein [Solirubrobacter phytolaccae]|uniref:VCBS repeat-containing protein n=1 Tax=Solirubrobacter phytolaccae TaxID=1404360 RepID=A0A9X3NBD4_9ACTN|nr:VCBS repeat-containing protein [Solirubrobacter phytolaccae]MDA0181989.1 VCBS repeat-containing protein [Solirubrobacter phytolaccae]